MKTDEDIEMPSTSGTFRNLIRCSYCQFSTESKTDVIEHILNDHREHDSSWKCNMCYRKISTKFRSTFKIHLQTHFGLKPFSCKFCMYKSTLKSGLKRHVKTKHENHGTNNRLASFPQFGTSGNFIHCSYCQFTSESKSDIIEHILNDHREPSSCWKCNMCYKEVCTNHRRTFKEHLQTHFGLKPFSCKFCKNSFSRKFSFNKHVKNYHPNEVTTNCSASKHETTNDKLKLQFLSSENTGVASSIDKTLHTDKNIEIKNGPKSILKQNKSISFHENKSDFSEKNNVILPLAISYQSKTNSPYKILDTDNSTHTELKYGFYSETPVIEKHLSALEYPNYISNEGDEMQKNISYNSYFSTTSTNNIIAQNKTIYTETLSSSKSIFHTYTETSVDIMPVSETSSSETIIEGPCDDRPLDLSVTRPNCKNKIQK